MKRFAAVTLALLMILTVFASAASAQVEIRGPVFNGSDIDNIIDTQGDGTTLTVDATEFAAFYYDINDNVTTETLSIEDVDGTEGNVIGEGGLIYETTIQQVEYEFTGADGWDNYSLMGFFAEKYIPLKSNAADKLAKLVLDSDDKYTIRTGETLDLGEGYTLEAKQVDVDGEKVWLQFNKDGEYVDDEIISVGTGDNAGGTWEVELDDIQDEDDVVVLRVHVNQVFQGAVDSIAQIEGLWLIDYDKAMTIESDDEFGELNDVQINGDTLSIRNEDTFTLTRDSDEEIGGVENNTMYFKIADTPVNELRYYPYVEKTVGPGNMTDDDEDENETEVDENETEVDENETEVDENATEEETEEETEEVTEENETEGNATEGEEGGEGGEEEPTTPGFGALLGLVGLVAVVYLVRRN
ncbi:MAG: S-layer protein domain-containing protein [Methanosarcina sp.]